MSLVFPPPASATSSSMSSTSLLDQSVGTVPIKLFVRGYNETLSVDDMWQIFTTYGEIASIIVDGHGATVTFKEDCTFPVAANLEMELTFGDKKMIVMKLGEAAAEYGDTSGHVQCQYDYYQEYPPQYYQYPPLSPTYDTAILDVGQCHSAVAAAPVPHMMNQFSVPPPPINMNQASAFTFDSPPVGDGDKTGQVTGGCHVCSGNSLQPLTPVTPTYQSVSSVPAPVPAVPTQFLSPPPTFYLPPSPASSTLLSLSGTSLLSTDSSSTYMMPIGSVAPPAPAEVPINPVNKKLTNTITDQKFKYFTSPYKKFSKFQGVPTPAKFPLNSVSASNVATGGYEDKSSWYKPGDSWGHRHTVRTVSQVINGRVQSM